MPTTVELARVNLVLDSGVQKIEIVFDNQFNLLNLLRYQPTTDKPVGFGEYFESKLAQSNLPFQIYRQKVYQGLRDPKTGTTLIYWNANNRDGYLNVSIKKELYDNLFQPIHWLPDEPTFLFVGEGYTNFCNQVRSLGNTDDAVSSTTEEFTQSRMAIPVDIDKRFPRTKRVRLLTTAEIDNLCTALLPLLKSLCNQSSSTLSSSP